MTLPILSCRGAFLMAALLALFAGDPKPMIARGEVVSEMSKNIWSVFQDSKGNYWFASDGVQSPSDGQGVYRAGARFRWQIRSNESALDRDG